MPYEANVFMAAIDKDPRRVTEVTETPQLFLESLWEARRDFHNLLYVTDESGDASGWCTLARIFLLSSKVRRSWQLPAEYVMSKSHYEKLISAGLLMSELHVSSYSVVHVTNTIRLMASKWYCSSAWIHGRDTTIVLMECLLYDLNLRMEVVWQHYREKSFDQAKNSVFNLVRTIAQFHAMMGFTRHNVICLRQAQLDADLVPETHLHDRIPSAAYEQGLNNLRHEMDQAFDKAWRLGGNMREKMTTTVCLLSPPIDTLIRAHTTLNVRVPDIILAARTVLPLYEIIWMATQLGELRGSAYLDGEWLGERA